MSGASPLRLAILSKYGTQERFSRESGIHEAIVSKICRGHRKPTKGQKEKFEILLGVPFDDLHGESHAEPSE